MKLLHLRIACYLYNQFSDYDDSYLRLLTKYQHLDLTNKEHSIALIEWLRSWGCRQFKRSNQEKSIKSIMEWYTSLNQELPNNNDHLIDYDLSRNKTAIIEIFNDLSNRCAATRKLDNNEYNVRIGPVGTAKALFALRPNIFPPWDTPIYKRFNLEGNGFGYFNYLKKVKIELLEIRDDLDKIGIGWDELFNHLNKKHKSYPKLIDEYYWTKITRRCDPLEIEKIGSSWFVVEPVPPQRGDLANLLIGNVPV